MKNFLLLFLLSSVVFSQDFKKDLRPFKSITITASMDVELILSDVYKIEVFGKDADKLNIFNKNKELKLTTALKKKFKTDLKVKVFYQKGMRFIKLANWINFSSKQPIVEPFLEIEMTNNVKASLIVHTEDFISKLQLGSSLLLSGFTNTQKIKALSKSFYDAFNFKSKKAFVEVRSAQAGIFVADFLDATAKFKGEITYMGNPFSVNEKTFLGKLIHKP